MARLVPGTTEYSEVFGAGPELPAFTSQLPEYYAITQAWADPSLRLDLGLDKPDGLYAKCSKDVQSGSRRMMWSLGVPGDANVPLALLSGIRELVFSAPITQQLSEPQVAQIFDPSRRPPGAPGIAGVAIGAALAAAGMAVPIVGQIAGALVAFGSMIYRAVNRNKAQQDINDEKVRQALYESFPPLQVADSATDTQIVRRVHSMLETGDITDIFMPRFKGTWVGIERAKGFAFAPGEPGEGSDVFGEEQQQFIPAGGIGCIPNTGIITSVIQVSLDPLGDQFKRFQAKGYPDPRVLTGAAERVIDTGSFYRATSDQASLAWSQATTDRGEQGNPLLYRLAPRRMSDAWRAYFEGGIDYIKDRAFPWWAKVLQGDGSIDKNANLEGFYAPAVFHAVGAWSGRLGAGSTTMHPKFDQWAAPAGEFREGMKQKKLYHLSDISGAFLPILDKPTAGFVQSMGNQWDRGPDVKGTCATLADQQKFDLENTLVALYVRRTDAAFIDDVKLAEQLDARRRAILGDKTAKGKQTRDRVVWPDIPESETLDGTPLRDQALKAGVSMVPKLVSGTRDRLAQKRPELGGFKMPGAAGRGAAGYGLAAAGTVLALSTLAYKAWRKPRWV